MAAHDKFLIVFFKIIFALIYF